MNMPTLSETERLLWNCLCYLVGVDDINKQGLIDDVERHFGVADDTAVKPIDNQLTDAIKTLRIIKAGEYGEGASFPRKEAGECLRRLGVDDGGSTPDDISVKYNELIFAVGIKHDNESRHDTALRYINEAEKGSDEVKNMDHG